MKIRDFMLRAYASIEYRSYRLLGITPLLVLFSTFLNKKPISSASLVLFQFATTENFDSLCNDSEMDINDLFIKQALRKNHTCVVALIEKKVVAYSWFANSNAHVRDDIWLNVPTNAWYIYKSFVSKEFRGKNILCDLLDSFKRSSMHIDEVMFCFISPTNNSSIKAFKKNMFQVKGYLVLLNRKNRLFSYFSKSLSPLKLKLYKNSDFN